jgi:hypothetical protein
MLPTGKPNPTASVRSGPNFVGLWDQEQDPQKLFKKYHIVGDDKRGLP